MDKVALIGRVNVGKSTLFNRLIIKPKAIVSKIPGTTRDRNYGLCKWQDKNFVLIDTGGLTDSKKELKDLELELEKKVKQQIIKAAEEADLILFVLDINEEISSFEQEISRIIKKTKKPALLVLNKADNPVRRELVKEFRWLQLGFGQPYSVSAINGSGSGDLLDQIVEKLGPSLPPVEETKPLRISIIGKPNVGKSTLLNELLGEEKVIVSPIPHTTRGPQDTLIYYHNQPLLLIDTAGIRKKSKISQGLERIGVRKSLVSLKKTDIALVVIDINQTISHQDKALISLAVKSKPGLILVINKIDKIPDFGEQMTKFIKNYQQTLPMASFAPIIFISAQTGQNVKKIFDLIEQVEKNYHREIENSELTNLLKQIVIKKKFNPDVWNRITISQTNAQPPEFSLRVSKNIIRKKLIHQAQLNIIEKEIRKKWRFEGTPISINFKS